MAGRGEVDGVDPFLVSFEGVVDTSCGYVPDLCGVWGEVKDWH